MAPVRIGKRAVVGAGTTVTRDVAAGALALSRVPQVERPGYADKVAERYAGPSNGARKARRSRRPAPAGPVEQTTSRKNEGRGKTKAPKTKAAPRAKAAPKAKARKPSRK